MKEVAADAVPVKHAPSTARNTAVHCVTGEIAAASRDTWRALSREGLVGLVNGLCFGVVIGLVGWFWKGMPILGVVAAIAMLANMIAAAIAGTLVPLVLRRVGADPALASGVIVTTFTDVTGYGCFLGLATVLIRFFPVAG